MKYTKANADIVKKILIFLIVLAVFVSLSFTTRNRITGVADTFLDSNFNFLLVEELTEEESRQNPIPEEYLEYAKEFAKAAFDNSYYTTNDAGSLVFLEPFEEGIADVEKFRGYSLVLAYSTLYQYPGVTVAVYHQELKRTETILTPKDVPYLRYKKVCLLPKDENDQSIRSSLAYHLFGPRHDTSLLAREIIESGNKDDIAIYVENGGMGAAAKPLNHVIFKYEQDVNTPRGIPVYIYDDTLCILGITEDAQDGVVFAENSRFRELIGNGFMYWPTATTIQDQNLKFTGSTT